MRKTGLNSVKCMGCRIYELKAAHGRKLYALIALSWNYFLESTYSYIRIQYVVLFKVQNLPKVGELQRYSPKQSPTE